MFGKLFYVTSTPVTTLYVWPGQCCNNHMSYLLLLWNLCLFTLFTSLTGQSPIHRRKPLPFKICRVMSQSGILYERLESLERSRRGHSRRASREHKAEPWKKLLGVLSDKAQTLQYDRTFHSKQSHDFCFSILTVFGRKMTSQC